VPNTIVIREFGYLSAGENGNLSPSAFSYLRYKAISPGKNNRQFLILTSRHGVECLQARNFVGVISTPDGTVIEILPKHTAPEDKIVDSRRLLWKMLRVVYKIPWQSSTDAALQTYKESLPELLITRFLDSVSHLVHRGLRSDYHRIHETRKFLKGRLNVSKQLRLPPSRATEFSVDFDAYTVNRAENRLIKLALDRVSKWRLGVANTRLAKELSIAFADVEVSQDIAFDFSRWRRQRDMAHYQPVKPWLELILRNLTPWLFSGGWQGISMLFPMEQLFENYLEIVLRQKVATGFTLTGQASSEYLTVHQGRRMFQLRPDFLIKQSNNNYCAMDAKWKLLDQTKGDSLQKYNLKQADLYQLFAYGQKYLDGRGELLLIFPKHEGFITPLAPFHYSDNLRLWVVPFDLDNDALIMPVELELDCFTNLQVKAA